MVARAEEPLASHVHVGVVLVPAVPRAAARGIHDVLRVVHGAERDLEEAGQERRAVGVGHRERVLGWQRVALRRRVVRDVVAGRLRVEPLAGVRLCGLSALGQLGGRARPVRGQVAVVAELVAHDDECGVERRSDLVDGAEDEAHELVGVDLGRLCGGGHGRLLLCSSVDALDRTRSRRWDASHPWDPPSRSAASGDPLRAPRLGACWWVGRPSSRRSTAWRPRLAWG